MRGFPILSLLLLAACGEATGADVLRAMVWPIPLPASLFEATPAEREGEWDAPVADPVPEEGERRLWRTPGGVVVATEGARVVATAGLRRVLAATRFEGADPLARLPELGDAEWRGTRVVDVMRSSTDPSRMEFGLRLDCRLRAAATEAEDTLLVEESCRGAARFTNRFWADARSYAVFRSEQWVGEGLPPLVVEVLAAPAAPAEVIPLPR